MSYLAMVTRGMFGGVKEAFKAKNTYQLPSTVAVGSGSGADLLPGVLTH